MGKWGQRIGRLVLAVTSDRKEVTGANATAGHEVYRGHKPGVPFAAEPNDEMPQSDMPLWRATQKDKQEPA